MKFKEVYHCLNDFANPDFVSRDFDCTKDVNSIVNELYYVSEDMQDGINDMLLNTGFTTFATVDFADNSLSYLCKKLKKLPSSVKSTISHYLDWAYAREKAISGKFIPENFSDSYGMCLNIAVSEIKDDTLKVVVGCNYGYSKVLESYTVVSKDKFYNGGTSIETGNLGSVVNSILNALKGFEVDYFCISLYSNLAVDFSNPVNLSKFSYYLGVTRSIGSYKNEGSPLTENTIDAYLIIVPNDNVMRVKRDDFYCSLLNHIRDEYDTGEMNYKPITNGDEDTIIGYTVEGLYCGNSEYNVLFTDTVESLRNKDKS